LVTSSLTILFYIDVEFYFKSYQIIKNCEKKLNFHFGIPTLQVTIGTHTPRVMLENGSTMANFGL
jgi:hypothetical protein